MGRSLSQVLQMVMDNMKKNIAQINSIEDFHAHLDECERCRSQPFNLCPEGELVLKRVLLKGKVSVEDIQRYTRRVMEGQ